MNPVLIMLVHTILATHHRLSLKRRHHAYPSGRTTRLYVSDSGIALSFFLMNFAALDPRGRWKV
jgi:hypothetical protein